MKTTRLGFALFLCLPFLFGCDSTTTIENPPEFVDMYLDDEEAVVETSEDAIHSRHQKIEYDEAIYSEHDFNVVVTTNGVNYDLLYSVELNDSLLGPCVYTDQSELYHATSSIVIEADQSYTTIVTLTIPGSTEHDSYLSDRTISLTKILFSRDTVDGTFPADIPENTTTVLNFEVHAVNYFDSTLGFQVKLNEGIIDVVIKPDTPEYTAAQTAAQTNFVIPNTINGYGIGRVYLQNLSWVTSLTIAGATEDVFILGEFPLLTELSIADLFFEPPLLNPYYKHLTINGTFSLLTSIIIEDCSGYRVFISENNLVENADYTAFKSVSGMTIYSFPELAMITIDNSNLNIFQIGRDFRDYPFPKLTVISVTDSVIASFLFGEEGNDFPKLAAINVNATIMSDIDIRGSKPETDTPAYLNLTAGQYEYIEIKGSIIGSVDLSGSSVKSLEIYEGTTYPSALNSLILDGITFEAFYPSIRIQGDQPNMTMIELFNLSLSAIVIGTDTDTFAALESIDISNVSATSIQIGQRATSFPVLTDLTVNSTTILGDLRIGDESSTFPLLEELYVTNSTFTNLKIGRFNDEFAVLNLIYLENITLSGELIIASIVAPELAIIVLNDITASSLSVSPTLPITETYVVYIDNLVLSSTLYFNSSCNHIYLVESDVTTWAYYAAVNALGIAMSTGTYVVV